MKNYLLLVTLLSITLLSFGQEDKELAVKDVYEMSLEELMNIEVYGASRTHGESSSTAPATVKVITQQQIVDRGYRSLLDILYDMPDVKVDYGVDPRWMNDITIRGIRYMDKFQILLNGVKISSPTNDMISVMENYPVNFAKQVEIIYGPASALYGADAFSGIINIITEQNADKPVTAISVEGGMYNMINGNFYHQDQLAEDLSFSMGGQFFFDQQPDLAEFYPDLYEGMDEELQTGIFNTIFGPISPSAPVEPEKSHNLMAYGLYTGLSYKDFKLSYFGNLGKNPSTMANSPHNAVYNKDQFFGHYVNMVNLSYERDFDKLKSLTSVTYSRYDLDSRSNFRNIWTNMEPAYLFAYGYMAKAEQLVSYNVNDNFSLTGGVTFEHYFSMPRSNNLQYPVFGDNPDGVIVNSIAPNNPDGIPADLARVDYNNIGGLLQAKYTFDFPLTVTAGARVDNDDRFGTTVNPRLGLVYEQEKNYTLKALYGSAFLAPSPQYMYDRYGTFNTDDGGNTYYSFFFQLPNEDLEPQKVQTIEFSGQKYIGDNLSLTLTGYTSFVTGLISPVADSATVSEIYPDFVYPGTDYPLFGIQINDNLGESTIYGGNLTIDFQQELSQDMKVFSSLTYSYIDGITDVDEGGPFEERNLPGISNHTVKLRGTVKWKDLTASIGFIWMSEQRVINAASVVDDGDDNPFNNDEYQTIDGFVLLNANVNYQLTPKFGLFVKGTNFLDQRYTNVNIGAAPESAGAGSAAVEFADGAPQNPLRVMGGFRITL